VFALGLMLVVLGAALAAAEAHVQSSGLLGVPAVVALTAGVVLVVTSATSAVVVALCAGLVVAVASAASLWLMLRKGLATRRLRASNTLVGRVGVVRSSDMVFVDGALWKARPWPVDEQPALTRGQHVVVEDVNGLTLTVRPAEEWEVAP
jgi:membrane protein implicated in regulation of membrane protease activity